MIDRSLLRVFKWGNVIPCGRFFDKSVVYSIYVSNGKLYITEKEPDSVNGKILKKSVKHYGNENSRYHVMSVPAKLMGTIGIKVGDMAALRRIEGGFTIERATAKEAVDYGKKRVNAVSGRIVNEIGHMYFTPEEKTHLGYEHSYKGVWLKVVLNMKDKACLKVELLDTDKDANLMSLRDALKAIGRSEFYTGDEREYKFRMVDAFIIPAGFLKEFSISKESIMNVILSENKSLTIEPPVRSCDFTGDVVHGSIERPRFVNVCEHCGNNLEGARHIIQECDGDIKAAALEAIRRIDEKWGAMEGEAK